MCKVLASFPPAGSMFSVRIVTADHYQASPVRGLDVIYSDFRGMEVNKVPVIRIFGSTPAGQKTCMHVHGVFPYLYVPYDGTQPLDRYLRLFATSLDKAVNVATGNPSSQAKHVYKITLVSGIPMYGYHPKEEQFLKIYMYNPNLVKKVADLLLGGAVLNNVFQPHETHIPYLLQMFIDYNLYGMNLLNVGEVKFRQKNQDCNSNDVEDNQGSQRSFNSDSLIDNISIHSLSSLSSCNNTPSRQKWDLTTLPSELMLDSSVERQSTCALEVDVVAADILNRMEVDTNIGTNPGLAALWDDERQRRRERGESSQITPAQSQDRENIIEGDSEQVLRERLRDIVLQHLPYIDSQSDDDSEMSQDSPTLTEFPASFVELHPSGDEISSQDTVVVEEEEKPIVNVESIHHVVSSSQSFTSGSTQAFDSQDGSLACVLSSLAAFNVSPAGSQVAASQLIKLEDHDSILSETSPLVIDGATLQQEEEEAMEMTQILSDDESDIQGSKLEGKMPEKFEFNLAGFDETWDGSKYMSEEETIPQYDGPVDEKPEDQSKLRKRLGPRVPVTASNPSRSSETLPAGYHYNYSPDQMYMPSTSRVPYSGATNYPNYEQQWDSSVYSEDISQRLPNNVIHQQQAQWSQRHSWQSPSSLEHSSFRGNEGSSFENYSRPYSNQRLVNTNEQFSGAYSYEMTEMYGSETFSRPQSAGGRSQTPEACNSPGVYSGHHSPSPGFSHDSFEASHTPAPLPSNMGLTSNSPLMYSHTSSQHQDESQSSFHKLMSRNDGPKPPAAAAAAASSELVQQSIQRSISRCSTHSSESMSIGASTTPDPFKNLSKTGAVEGTNIDQYDDLIGSMESQDEQVEGRSSVGSSSHPMSESSHSHHIVPAALENSQAKQLPVNTSHDDLFGSTSLNSCTDLSSDSFASTEGNRHISVEPVMNAGYISSYSSTPELSQCNTVTSEEEAPSYQPLTPAYTTGNNSHSAIASLEQMVSSVGYSIGYDYNYTNRNWPCSPPSQNTVPEQRYPDAMAMKRNRLSLKKKCSEPENWMYGQPYYQQGSWNYPTSGYNSPHYWSQMDTYNAAYTYQTNQMQGQGCMYPINRPMASPGSVPEKGKRGRKKSCFSMSRCSSALGSDSTSSRYTYTFHVPTPVYKRLKLLHKSSTPKIDDVCIVRMHPMDARRYSLLKIGRELVKVQKMSTKQIEKIKKDLKQKSRQEFLCSFSDRRINIIEMKLNANLPFTGSSHLSQEFTRKHLEPLRTLPGKSLGSEESMSSSDTEIIDLSTCITINPHREDSREPLPLRAKDSPVVSLGLEKQKSLDDCTLAECRAGGGEYKFLPERVGSSFTMLKDVMGSSSKKLSTISSAAPSPMGVSRKESTDSYNSVNDYSVGPAIKQRKRKFCCSENRSERTKRASVNYSPHAFTHIFNQEGVDEEEELLETMEPKDEFTDKVCCVVVNKFKGHKSLVVKLEKLNLQNETVKVSEFLAAQKQTKHCGDSCSRDKWEKVMLRRNDGEQCFTSEVPSISLSDGKIEVYSQRAGWRRASTAICGYRPGVESFKDEFLGVSIRKTLDNSGAGFIMSMDEESYSRFVNTDSSSGDDMGHSNEEDSYSKSRGKCKRKRSLTPNQRLGVAFLTTRHRRRRSLPPSGGKLMNSLSLLHQATLAKLTNSSSYTDRTDDYKTGYQDVMSKLALFSPPQSEKGDTSPPQPLSPDENGPAPGAEVIQGEASNQEISTIRCLDTRDAVTTTTTTTARPVLLSQSSVDSIYETPLSSVETHRSCESAKSPGLTSLGGSETEQQPEVLETKAEPVVKDVKPPMKKFECQSLDKLSKDDGLITKNSKPYAVKTAVVKLIPLSRSPGSSTADSSLEASLHDSSSSTGSKHVNPILQQHCGENGHFRVKPALMSDLDCFHLQNSSKVIPEATLSTQVMPEKQNSVKATNSLHMKKTTDVSGAQDGQTEDVKEMILEKGSEHGQPDRETMLKEIREFENSFNIDDKSLDLFEDLASLDDSTNFVLGKSDESLPHSQQHLAIASDATLLDSKASINSDDMDDKFENSLDVKAVELNDFSSVSSAEVESSDIHYNIKLGTAEECLSVDYVMEGKSNDGLSPTEQEHSSLDFFPIEVSDYSINCGNMKSKSLSVIDDNSVFDRDTHADNLNECPSVKMMSDANNDLEVGNSVAVLSQEYSVQKESHEKVMTSLQGQSVDLELDENVPTETAKQKTNTKILNSDECDSMETQRHPYSTEILKLPEVVMAPQDHYVDEILKLEETIHTKKQAFEKEISDSEFHNHSHNPQILKLDSDLEVVELDENACIEAQKEFFETEILKSDEKVPVQIKNCSCNPELLKLDKKPVMSPQGNSFELALLKLDKNDGEETGKQSFGTEILKSDGEKVVMSLQEHSFDTELLESDENVLIASQKHSFDNELALDDSFDTEIIIKLDNVPVETPKHSFDSKMLELDENVNSSQEHFKKSDGNDPVNKHSFISKTSKFEKLPQNHLFAEEILNFNENVEQPSCENFTAVETLKLDENVTVETKKLTPDNETSKKNEKIITSVSKLDERVVMSLQEHSYDVKISKSDENVLSPHKHSFDWKTLNTSEDVPVICEGTVLEKSDTGSAIASDAKSSFNDTEKREMDQSVVVDNGKKNEVIHISTAAEIEEESQQIFMEANNKQKNDLSRGGLSEVKVADCGSNLRSHDSGVVSDTEEKLDSFVYLVNDVEPVDATDRLVPHTQAAEETEEQSQESGSNILKQDNSNTESRKHGALVNDSKIDAKTDTQCIVLTPQEHPPSKEQVFHSAQTYGLNISEVKDAFCSNPSDAPERPRELGGRVLKLESNLVKDLQEFSSALEGENLQTWRYVMAANDSGLALQTELNSFFDSLSKDQELYCTVFGDRERVITPCLPPPSRLSVSRCTHLSQLGKTKGICLADQVKAGVGLKNSRIKHTEHCQDKNSVVKHVELECETSAVTSSSSMTDNRCIFEDSSVENLQLEGTIKKNNHLIENLTFSGSKVDESCEDATLCEVETKAGREEEEETDIDVEESQSDATRVVEMSGSGISIKCLPHSVKHLSVGVYSVDDISTSNFHKCEKTVCRMTPLPRVLKRSFSDSATMLECGKEVSSRSSDLNWKMNTSPTLPKQLRFDGEDSLCLHSTPVSKHLMSSMGIPSWTPIASLQSQAGECKKAEKTKPLQQPLMEQKVEPRKQRQVLSRTENRLRRALLLTTQLKKTRRSMSSVSQIEGSMPKNLYGFKVSQLNLEDAKALHEVQHLTIMSLELHAETRGDLQPDPEFDTVRVLFLAIHSDSSKGKHNQVVVKVLAVDPNSSMPKEEEPHPSTSSVAPSEKKTCDVASGLFHKSGIDSSVDVTYVQDEEQLIVEFLQLVRHWDPDILVGYEIQMFSWGYLLQRAAHLSIELCSKLSRIPDSKSYSHFEKDEWGADFHSDIHIAGRIVLNLWRIMKHEVTLGIYTFENVAYHVLHQRIPRYSFRNLTAWFSGATHLNRWRVVQYYLTRVCCNLHLIQQLDLIGKTSELARVFGIQFYHVLCRGSQYRVESMMLRIAKPLNYISVSPSVYQRAKMRAPECIPLTLEPESRFYTHPVVVLDFQSLYPSIMIAYNYCFSTCLGRLESLAEAHEGPIKFGCTSLNVSPLLLKKLESNVTISPNGVVFVKQHVRRGILPRMVDEILRTRIMVKKAIKDHKEDKSLQRLLDARQLALKLIANVTYGYTGASFSGRMPCIEVGDSIVRKARETLERAIKLVEETPQWGAQVVYGDTDSMFLLLKGQTKETAFRIGQEIADAVTAMNPKPIKLRFEKVYLPCLLQTKKRYVGFMYESPAQREPLFDAKGIETVRRDTCGAVSKILEKSIKVLFTSRDVSQVKRYVQRQCSKLMEGRVSLQDFIFAKEYRGVMGYKPGACVPALEIAKKLLCQDRRRELRVGERVPYVIVYGGPGLPLIQLVRQPLELFRDPSLRLNTNYYISKQILPPLDRLFSLLGVDVFTWYQEMPRVVRCVPQSVTAATKSKKGTISQYFTTTNCPVCDEQTKQVICSKCMNDPQAASVELNTQICWWERTHTRLTQICHSCMGVQDHEKSCVSLDCPVLFRLSKAAQDVEKCGNLRRVLNELLEF